MNSEPNTVTSTNQFDIGTSTATAPAAARSTNPDATVTMSMHGDVLEPRAVEHRRATTYTPTTATVCHRPVSAATPSAGDDQDRADDLGRADGHDAGGDRAEALRRVDAVGLDVEGVVPEVDAAGGEAEGDERQHRAAERRPVVEHAGGAGGGEHEHVLDPLLRAGPCAAGPWASAVVTAAAPASARPSPTRRGRRRRAARGRRASRRRPTARRPPRPPWRSSSQAWSRRTFSGPGSCRRRSSPVQRPSSSTTSSVASTASTPRRAASGRR